MTTSTSSIVMSEEREARLVITKQESPEQDTLYKNGENKIVHTVVKIHPFVIELGLSGGDVDKTAINFNRCTLEAALMYDSPNVEPSTARPVHFVARRPIEYNCTVLNPEGDKVRVECTIQVLSSQHEGAHFRLQFSLRSSAATKDLVVLSEPIRVVSKPLQLRRHKEEKKRQQQQQQQQATSSSVSGASTQIIGKKRPFEDTIQETLSRIEAQQQAQQKLISGLLQTVTNLVQQQQQQQQVPEPSPSSYPTTPFVRSPATASVQAASPAAIFEPPESKKRRREEASGDPPATSSMIPQHTDYPRASFEVHLRGLCNAYHALAPSHREQAVGSVIREITTNSDSQQRGQLVEVVGVLSAVGLGRSSAHSDGRRLAQRYSSVEGSDDECGTLETWLSTETTPAASPTSPGGIPPFFPLMDHYLEDDKTDELFYGQTSWFLDPAAASDNTF